MTTKNIGGSILPSSDASILKPMEGRHGTFQVRAIAELDTHCLFYSQGSYNSVIAMHANGYSCHSLAKRIIEVWEGSKPAQHAIEQRDYINRCGGMTKDDATMQHVIRPEEY